MTQNEMELVTLIRESDDPEHAIKVAIEIICQYIGLHESCPEQAAACPQVPA